jgi:hypothetical protein
VTRELHRKMRIKNLWKIVDLVVERILNLENEGST